MNMKQRGLTIEELRKGKIVAVKDITYPEPTKTEKDLEGLTQLQVMELLGESPIQQIIEEIVDLKDSLVGKHVKIDTTYGGSDMNDITIKGTVVDITTEYIEVTDLAVNGKKGPFGDDFVWKDGKVMADDISYIQVIDSLECMCEFSFSTRILGLNDKNPVVNISNCDLGEKVRFNIADGTTIDAPILSLQQYPQDNESIIVTCRLSEEHYHNFVYSTNDTVKYVDYSLDKCLIEGISYLNSYVRN